MWSLADIPGQYPVGSATFACTVQDENASGLVIGNAKLKLPGLASPVPALVLKEVAFTAFYPAEVAKNHRKGMRWLTKPQKEMLRGYSIFAGIPFYLLYWLLGAICSRIKVPVYPGAPLLDPNTKGPGDSWPLVIFSHGLGGTRMNYSHLCTQLASKGNVILAMEHRDGTEPFVTLQSRTPESGRQGSISGGARYYIKPEDVHWEDVTIPEDDKFALRSEQLLFRSLEIHIAYTRFRDLVQSATLPERPLLYAVDGPQNSSDGSGHAFWKSWMKGDNSLPRVRCEQDVALTGHSFGAATVLFVLSQHPPSLAGLEVAALPVSRAIAYDPWVEPLPSPGPAPRQTNTPLPAPAPQPAPSILFLNSEGYTLWEDHFQRLRGIVELWKGTLPGEDRDSNVGRRPNLPASRLITLIRAKHISFSDFGILVPWGKNAEHSQTFLDVICGLSGTFLKGDETEFDQTLQDMRVQSGATEVPSRDNDKGKRRFIGEVGDIIIHT